MLRKKIGGNKLFWKSYIKASVRYIKPYKLLLTDLKGTGLLLETPKLGFTEK